MAVVSVIMAAHNAGAWIEGAAGSVLGQTWQDLELVVVDDGSADDTVERVGRLRDARVVVVRQERCGQGAALNRGVAVARGSYVKFVDADDWINPGHLEAMMGVLAGTEDVVGACGWGYFVGEPAGVVARDERVNRDYGDPLEWLVDSLSCDEGMMGGWKWLIPRRVWDRCGGWDERLGLNNDFDFSIRLLLASSGVRHAAGAVYGYRKGVGGALSGARGRVAMESAYRTTESGCRALLAREDSARVRRVCADRWQEWLYRFYPEHLDLAEAAEREVARLGGSDRRMEGGSVQRWLVPVLGWRGVRRLQVMAYRNGWGKVLAWKAGRRLRRMVAADAGAGSTGKG